MRQQTQSIFPSKRIDFQKSCNTCSCSPTPPCNPPPSTCSDLKVRDLESCGDVDFCNACVKLSNIVSCGNSPINVTGNLFVNGTVSSNSIIVCNISSCGDVVTFSSDVIFQGNVNIGGNLSITNLTIPGDIIVQGTASFCNNPIRVNALTPCSGNTITINGNIMATSGTFPVINGPVTFTNNVTVNGPGGLTSCNLIKTNNLQACTDPININSTVIFTKTVTFCGNLQSCNPGGTINVISNVTFGGNVIINGPDGLTACSGITTNLLTSCNGNPIVISSGINITSIQGLNVCAGPITVSTINSCTAAGITINGPVTFTSPLNLCGAPLLLTGLSPCPGSTTITVNGDLSLCAGGGTLRTGTIAGCGSGININSTDVTFSGDVTICSGNLFINNVFGCAGGAINVTSTDVILSGNLSVCSGAIRTNNINPCTAGGTITIGNSGILSACSGITTSVINGCGSGLTITANTTFTGTVSICPGPLHVATISPCTPGGTTSFTSNVNICSGALTINTLNGCTPSGITINSPVTFVVQPNVSFCSSPLQVGTLTACPGNTSIIVNTMLDLCSGSLRVGTVTDCGAGINVNANTTFSNNVTVGGVLNVCAGSLSVGVINGCGSGLIISAITTFTNNVTVQGTLSTCGGGSFSTASITSCGAVLTITAPTTTLTGNLNVCSGSISTNTLNSCGGSLTINPNTIFGGNITVCAGSVSTNTISPCAPSTQVTFTGTGIIVNTITATNYNFVNTNVGTNVPYSQSYGNQYAGAVAGPLNGPGGNVRNFRTIIGTDPTTGGVYISEDTSINNIIVENLYGNLRFQLILDSPGQSIPSGVWTQVEIDSFGGSATIGLNGVDPLVAITTGPTGSVTRLAVPGLSPVSFLNGFPLQFETAVGWVLNNGIGRRAVAVLVGNNPYVAEVSAVTINTSSTIPGAGTVSYMTGPSFIVGAGVFGPGDSLTVWVYQDSGSNQTIGNNVGSNTIFFKARFLPG